MNIAFDILVFVLAGLLAIFLILSIIVIMKVKKLVAAVEQVVAKGEQVIDSAEAAAELFKRTAGPAGMIKTIMSIVEFVAKHNKRKD